MSDLSCLGQFCKHCSLVHRKYPWRMGTMYVILFIVVLSAVLAPGASTLTRQNIVFIVADDLGWNDVSFHGSDQIITPNIDLLAYTGMGLERYYSHCICTPSRSALLTGKYAHVTGMQGYPLTNSEDRGLPITEKILPQYLKELGYTTHLVGKWHVGSSRTEYLPTKRGFDTHFGHRGGYIDYYEYTLDETIESKLVSGMGLFRNDTPAWDVEGYLTDIYNEAAISVIKAHDESSPLFLMVAHNAPHGSTDAAVLQAPPNEVRAMRHVEVTPRRIFAATMKKLDDSIGDIIEALEEKGILNNTIIVFITDNGAMTSGISLNFGSNWPLRGIKMTPYEGGVRVTGAMWTPQQWTNHLFKGYFHTVDWLPTLLKAIGAEIPSDIDGINLWDDIRTNKVSSREEMFEIDDYTGFASIIQGEYKLITGDTNPDYSNYQGGDLLGIIGEAPPYMNAIEESKAYKSFRKIGIFIKPEQFELRRNIQVKCKASLTDKDICYTSKDKVCLFNIKEDPCETTDLSKTHPDVTERMLTRLMAEKKRVKPRTVPLIRDLRSLPALFNYTWAPFADNF